MHSETATHKATYHQSMCCRVSPEGRRYESWYLWGIMDACALHSAIGLRIPGTWCFLQIRPYSRTASFADPCRSASHIAPNCRALLCHLKTSNVKLLQKQNKTKPKLTVLRFRLTLDGTESLELSMPPSRSTRHNQMYSSKIWYVCMHG